MSYHTPLPHGCVVRWVNNYGDAQFGIVVDHALDLFMLSKPNHEIHRRLFGREELRYVASNWATWLRIEGRYHDGD